MIKNEKKQIAPEIGEAKRVESEEQTIFTLADLLKMEVTELPCLFEPIFLKSGLAVMVGGSDTGKSSLLRQMCMSVATGRDFLGWKYQGKHHRAIYFSSEDDKTITAKVVKSYNKTMQLNPEAAKNLRFVFEIDPGTIAQEVATMLNEEPADLIVIDAFGDAFNGKNINDNTEVRKFYNLFKPIIKQHECLIIFNHHTGKRSDTYAVSKDNSLGSQAIEATPRLAIELRQDPTDPEIKHFCVVKANYLSSEFKRKSYGLKMDNNFVFAQTGQRLDFSELAKPSKPERKPKTPKAYSNETHRAFIRSIMESGELSQRDLLNHICAEYEVSQSYAKNFLAYYEQYKMVDRKEKGGQYNRVMYVSLVR